MRVNYETVLLIKLVDEKTVSRAYSSRERKIVVHRSGIDGCSLFQSLSGITETFRTGNLLSTSLWQDVNLIMVLYSKSPLSSVYTGPGEYKSRKIHFAR